MINSRLQGTLVLCGILLNCDFGLGTPLATLRSLGSPETVTGEEFYVESGGVYAVCSLDYTTDLVTLVPSVSFFSSLRQLYLLILEGITVVLT